MQKAFLHSTSQYIYLDLEKAMGFVETFADSLKEMPPAPMGEALRPLWSEALADIKAEHEAGADGQAVAQRIAEAMDAVVLSIYQSTMPQTSGPHALVALGGYGRCEMAPHSDVDLLFLFAKSQDKVPEVVAGVFNPLWDLGFEVGHSSRTLDEVVRAVREDLESRTAMMDGRLLAGDAALFAQFQQRLYKRVPKRTITELNRLRQQQLEARQSVQLLEPNVKESPGGLREIQMFEWALKAKAKAPECGDLCAQYLDGGSESLAKSRAFLWRVRHALHFAVGRKRDVLEHDIKPQIAAALGYEDQGHELAAECFMRDYYLHARTVYHLVERAFQRLTRKPRNSSRSMYIERGVAAVEGEIVLTDDEAYFAADPLRLLKIFLTAQTKNLKLSDQVQCAVRANLPLIDDEFRRLPAARDLFFKILKRKYRTALTLRRMHDLGVLGAYLPEFGRLTCLVQYDIYHIYTVDEHTLVALENLEALGQKEGSMSAILTQCTRRDLLFFAVLLHDVGKWKRNDHIARGIEMTEELSERMGLDQEERSMLRFLVKHHQDMVLISRRRNLDDYEMIAEFAGLFASEEWLRALYLVSYADLSAVAPDVWTDWQGALLWELYYKTAEQLHSDMQVLEAKQRARQKLNEHLNHIEGRWSAQRVVQFQEHIEQLAPSYLVAYNREQIKVHLEMIARLSREQPFVLEFIEHEGHTEIVVCTRDQRQIIAKICGALAVNDINILRADVNTRADDVVLDIFQVTDIDDSPALPDWKKERMRERVAEVISLRLKARDLIARYSSSWDRRRRQRQYDQPPRIAFDNQISARYTVVDIEAQDTVGLLYRIAYLLDELDLNIHRAIINTVAARAQDAFYIVDAEGQKIASYEELDRIEQYLLDGLAS